MSKGQIPTYLFSSGPPSRSRPSSRSASSVWPLVLTTTPDQKLQTEKQNPHMLSNVPSSRSRSSPGVWLLLRSKLSDETMKQYIHPLTYSAAAPPPRPGHPAGLPPQDRVAGREGAAPTAARRHRRRCRRRHWRGKGACGQAGNRDLVPLHRVACAELPPCAVRAHARRGGMRRCCRHHGGQSWGAPLVPRVLHRRPRVEDNHGSMSVAGDI